MLSVFSHVGMTGTLLTLQSELCSIHAISRRGRFIAGGLLTLHSDGIKHPRPGNGRGHEATGKGRGWRNHGAERRLLHRVLTGCY